MKSNSSMLYTVGNIFSKNIRYCLHTFEKDLIWNKYEHPKFWDSKSPNFGTPTWEFRGKKWHLDVVPMDRHKIYYREGSGASSQRLWAVWRLCLKLSLQSLLHHFHLICTNWHTPRLLNGLKCESRLKTVEKQKIEAHSLARNTLRGVEGRAGAPRWD
jgi:hypothetical protein